MDGSDRMRTINWMDGMHEVRWDGMNVMTGMESMYYIIIIISIVQKYLVH